MRLANIWAGYGKSPVLNGVDLELERGISYMLMGPSGSGKTTLLKLIVGFIVPSKGEMEIFGAQTVQGTRTHRDDRLSIGYIPQNLGLIRNLTVVENTLMGSLARLSLVSAVTKTYPAEELNRAREALEMVGLHDKEDKKIYELSGGEKQRVAIARSLVQRPTLLLADELVSDLDYVKAREIMEMIVKAKRRLDMTTLVVSHDIHLSKYYGDRVGIMKNGRILAELEASTIDEKTIVNLFNHEGQE